ncbi:uncharacterized protein LOC131331508 isoform X5 [Rhododendron vialii]|uniref:uncharacterized protein LOC131331508 isoform X5 n=1 Tax=Rhododendron vialii TaxID=182163 RepID=UPI00265E5BD6|nr:uncharacterized protein LOC131331508 isoform X5 [Rhododendron vialii]
MEKKGSSSLNIALIHPDLGIGGAERLIVDAAAGLASHGHKVHIFTAHHDRTRCFEETLAGTFQVTVYGAFLPRHIFYHLHAVVFYCHFPDLLLAQHTTILRQIYRKPIDFIEEVTTGMADLILVNSRFTASTFAGTFKHLHARGIKPAVLYPAVNVQQFDKPHAFKFNFLSVNRFERKKNVELAICAFSLLQTLGGDVQGLNVADATLTVVGKSISFQLEYRCGFDKRLRENVEYLEELKGLADRKGVSHKVKFMTSCSTAERNMLLSQCLCVLYTPKDEHFGIVPLEAMAAYKPVIACNSGGPVETIKNGVTGFLCGPSPQEFSSAMEKFIRDPQMAERMGSEARQHVVESFSTKIFGQHLNQILLDIARGKED